MNIPKTTLAPLLEHREEALVRVLMELYFVVGDSRECSSPSYHPHDCFQLSLVFHRPRVMRTGC
jgi:hypothetical protein